mmetsp:Transcript_21757/g.34091  ORF Transcript_21757/g.34091 Transcript_21757/m.34091 type:complete len:226 (+) Transcript_21757:77-754(+)|eukprot:CAMPEP_0184315556 /NCGR_PEP_ID=MMETSP1049-20130417/83335_1 /TAXON_ID=77928 /ORGANISM="Proteomonas sulcata, Strain CCMP704" /LENGTH=225 /DNA_ID=CAMNT_0026634109 /DNA_START=60 /DNA_END=737 /DNA_ORIENTATION=-
MSEEGEPAAPIELFSALERCSGDMSLFNQVVCETLRKSRDEQIGEIRSYFEAKDVSKVHFFAHSIKGACATIGFNKLSEAAKTLDDLAKKETLEGAGPLVDALASEIMASNEYWDSHEAAMNAAVERCGDDMELFQQISKEMAADVLPGQIEALEASVSEGDDDDIKNKAGQVLDAAETIGAAVLIDLLRKITDGNGNRAEIMEEVKTEADLVVKFWELVEVEED